MWVPILQRAYSVAVPNRDTFFHQSPGTNKTAEIYDSTAVIGVPKFASRLQTTLVPPWRNWSTLTPGAEIPDQEKEEAAKQLSEMTKILFRHINHSNFSTQSHETFQDIAVSTGILMLQEGHDEQLLEFNAIPTSNIVLEEGPNGQLENYWRNIDIAVRNIKRQWPDAKLNTELTKKLDDEKARAKLIDGVIFDPGRQVFDYVVIELASKFLMVHRVLDRNIYIGARWSVMPGEVYGRGPVINVLPDILTANKVVEFELRNAALAISGIYTATDDGVINPYTIQLVPNTVIPVASNDERNPSLKPLARSGDFNIGQLVLKDLRERIGFALFLTKERIGDVEGPTKSATEIAIRNQDLADDIGASFGRLQTEFVERVVKTAVGILQDRGKLPQFTVDGREVTLKHESPLARAQDLEEILSITRTLEILSALGPELVHLSVKTEDLGQAVGQRMGFPPELLRTEQEKQVVLEQAAEALKAQQQGPDTLLQPEQSAGAVPGAPGIQQAA